MALSASIVLEVQNGGSDTNGGGFKTGATGTDWSLQNGTQYSVTDGVTAGTTTITSATAAFGTDVVGNLIYVTGGTGSITAAWYEIVSRTNATTIVVDRSTGLNVGTGATLHIGGALASPGQAAAIATVAGQTIFIKYNVSPYVATSASTNIAAGCVSGTQDTAWSGYDTTRSLCNTDANRPTFQINSGVSAATLFGAINNQYFVSSIILDGNSQTTSKCFNSSGTCFNVKAMNGVSCGFQQNQATGVCIFCEATGCSSSPFVVAEAFFCIAHDNTTGGANTGGFQTSNCFGCISYANSRNGFYAPGGGTYAHCIAYGNTEVGFINGFTSLISYVNCIAEGNGLQGYKATGQSSILINCADYANVSGRKVGGTIWADIGGISGASTFFTDATNHDFRLNASAGVALKAAGFPAAFPATSTLTTNYRDIGAAQHLDSGGGVSTPYVIGS